MEITEYQEKLLAIGVKNLSSAAEFWVSRLKNPEYWLDKESSVRFVEEMETSHITNTILMLRRKQENLAICWVYDSTNPRLSLEYLDEDWLETTPIMLRFMKELDERGADRV